MTEDTVNPIEEMMIDDVEQPIEAQEDVTEDREETKVPLSALQKERKKRQEMEVENRLLREQQQQRAVPAEPDDSQYETVTRAELGHQTKEVIRQVEERSWIKNNPDKYEQVTELLPAFLKKRPNLALAISEASNRYEEAWDLMDKLTPRQQQTLKKASATKKDAPGSPTGAPKAAVLAEKIDVMSMTDPEFADWRRSKKRAR